MRKMVLQGFCGRMEIEASKVGVGAWRRALLQCGIEKKRAEWIIGTATGDILQKDYYGEVMYRNPKP